MSEPFSRVCESILSRRSGRTVAIEASPAEREALAAFLQASLDRGAERVELALKRSGARRASG